jgi:hypothetical protein
VKTKCRRSALWGAVALCLLAASCRKSALPAFTPSPALVNVTKAISRDVPVYLDEIGQGTAFNTITVMLQVSGMLREQNFEDGADGLESGSLNTFARRDSSFWSAGPALTWRIFSAGHVRANIRVQNARQLEAITQYRQAVLQSLQDMEDALVAYAHEQTRRETLCAAVQSAHRTVELSLSLYKAGVVDFLSVLTAQQSLYQSEDQLAQSEQAVSTDLVALYKALGGGWETAEEWRKAKSE